uniref:Sulfotransferase n=1 Tax=Neolamprologus brichardi TaxID=32507 RepID=A0A3Q4GXZ7_NEOBR
MSKGIHLFLSEGSRLFWSLKLTPHLKNYINCVSPYPLSFEVRDSDVFLVSYPKSGTIWAQQIITSIYELDGHVTEYFTNSQKMPWLEWVWGCAGGAYTRRPSPRLFTSHLSQVLMPPGLMDKKGKIVYLMRNPKDNMTSYYHFSKTLAGLETPQSFAQFFEWYLTGNVLLSAPAHLVRVLQDQVLALVQLEADVDDAAQDSPGVLHAQVDLAGEFIGFELLGAQDDVASRVFHVVPRNVPGETTE